MIDWVLTVKLYAAAAIAIGILVMGLCYGMSVLALRRRVEREAQSSATRHGELCEGFAELAAANAALRRQLVELADCVEQSRRIATSSAPVASTGRAYELAARLAAGGAASRELVANCGLTPAEAELAVLVHGGTRARTAAANH